jgi:hypothetical protein
LRSERVGDKRKEKGKVQNRKYMMKKALMKRHRDQVARNRLEANQTIARIKAVHKAKLKTRAQERVDNPVLAKNQ